MSLTNVLPMCLAIKMFEAEGLLCEPVILNKGSDDATKERIEQESDVGEHSRDASCRS